jgi:uncharacterized protein
MEDRTLKERLREDLNAARRGREKLRLAVLTTTISELRNREIELGHEAGDEEVVQVVQRAIKRRREAAEQMRGGGREELAAKEEAEAALLEPYLPPQLSEAQVRALVRDAMAGGADSVGAVMALIMPGIRGVFDGREANRIVREELGG